MKNIHILLSMLELKNQYCYCQLAEENNFSSLTVYIQISAIVQAMKIPVSRDTR